MDVTTRPAWAYWGRGFEGLIFGWSYFPSSPLVQRRWSHRKARRATRE